MLKEIGENALPSDDLSFEQLMNLAHYTSITF